MKQVTPDMFDSITNDVNGNPRYVIHFLKMDVHSNNFHLNDRYYMALALAKKVGGKKFHNKQYGGGIVFVSYSLKDTCRVINELLEKQYAAQTVAA